MGPGPKKSAFIRSQEGWPCVPPRMPPESTITLSAERSWVGQIEGHRSQLVRAVQRIAGSRCDAEDVVQEALIRAWRDRSRLAGLRSVRAWMIGIARNVALDRVRARNRRGETKELHSAIAVPSSMRAGPSARLHRQERQSGLRDALDRLSGVSREIVHLRHIEGLSFAAIAERISVQEPTARKRYSRALSQLREVMNA